MIICNQCGEALKDGARFCNECGAAVPGASSSPTPPRLDTSPLEETLVRPPTHQRHTQEPVGTQPLGAHQPDTHAPAPPRPSVAVPLVVLGVILGGGFLLLLGLNASRSNGRYNSNTYTNGGSYNYNGANTTNTNASANYSSNTGYANANTNRGNVNAGYNTNSNVGGYTSSPTPARSGFDYVEGKILNNSYISYSELKGLSPWQLKLLRNTVFAKYGRTYPQPEDTSVQEHFNNRPWYSPNYNYNSNQQHVSLSSADEANLDVIKAAEQVNSP
ncbi:MAG TPA: YARHG domain-containing protein [Pyrinomonadaceae bacterium]